MHKQDKKSLKEQVLHYQKTGEGFEALQEHLSLQVYRYFSQRLGWGHDNCCDFYLHFRPKIEHILKKYRDTGPPFAHYLHCVLRWQMRTFNRSQNRRKWRRQCAGEIDFWSDEYEKEAPLPAPDLPRQLARVVPLTEEKLILRQVERRQIFHYCLKKCRHFRDPHFKQLAMVTGYSLPWIRKVTASLCMSLEGKEKRLQMLRTRRFTAFFRIRCLERQLEGETCPEKRRTLSEQLSRQRLVLSRASLAVSRLRLAPTHKAISAATGYPKGTVDTDIAAIKKRLIKIFPG